MSRLLGPNGYLIERFLERLAQLQMSQFAEAVRTWRETLHHTDAWYGAEDAVGDAITLTGRHAEQWRLQDRLYQLFRGSGWFTERRPSLAVPATEAAAQYLASTAAFALLVADEIAPREFATLYAPFAQVISLAELGLGATPAAVLADRAARRWTADAPAEH